jgi:hypothetical protein
MAPPTIAFFRRSEGSKGDCMSCGSAAFSMTRPASADAVCPTAPDAARIARFPSADAGTMKASAVVR